MPPSSGLLNILHRQCECQSPIAITHGEFMSAAKVSLEYLSDEEWVPRDGDKAYKLYNTTSSTTPGATPRPARSADILVG